MKRRNAMTTEQYFINLSPPAGMCDVILDTDAYNEIDDQFAIGFMLKNKEKFNVKGICAAPFRNEKSVSAADGMEKSYHEILKLLDLMEMEEMKEKVYRGSEKYLDDENTPVESEAADFIANLANEYCPEKPLYIVAIGAITNVASAILKNPNIKENCVVVWLGGHAKHLPGAAREFNMFQDIAAARIVFGCGVPMAQLPCACVVESFATTGPELEYWLKGKNALCDYLLENTVSTAESYAKGKPWSRPIWDVTAVAWLMNKHWEYMREMIVPSPIPQYDGHYSLDEHRHFIKYVYYINRDRLFEELFRVLSL